MISKNKKLSRVKVNVTQSAHPLAKQYYEETAQIVLTLNDKDSSYKKKIANQIYDIVLALMDYSTNCKKVTDRLVELPLTEIRQYLTNFELFRSLVTEHTQIVEQKATDAAPHFPRMMSAAENSKKDPEIAEDK